MNYTSTYVPISLHMDRTNNRINILCLYENDEAISSMLITCSGKEIKLLPLHTCWVIWPDISFTAIWYPIPLYLIPNRGHLEDRAKMLQRGNLHYLAGARIYELVFRGGFFVCFVGRRHMIVTNTLPSATVSSSTFRILPRLSISVILSLEFSYFFHSCPISPIRLFANIRFNICEHVKSIYL